MNKLLLTLFCTVLLAGTAHAQTPATAAGDADQAAEKSNVTAGSTTEAQAVKELLSGTNCVRETGSHITRKSKDYCVNTTGRSYDKKNFDLTTSTETAKVLPQLDTAVEIRR